MNISKTKPLRIVSPVHKAIRHMAIHLGSQMDKMPILQGDGHLMSYLYLYSPCPISELGRVFGHKKTTLTSILDRLEQGGLLKRSINPDDRRSFVITSTAKGKKMGKAARSIAERFDSEVCRRVKESDLQGFARVMEAIGQVSRVTVGRTRKA